MVSNKNSKISGNSPYHDKSYLPKFLLKDDKNNYCSVRNAKTSFIEFDFEKEYFFIQFYIIFKHKKENKPKNYNIEFYDNKKRIIRTINFTTDENNISETKGIWEKARYLKLNLTSRYEGDYFEISYIGFIILNLYSIES